MFEDFKNKFEIKKEDIIIPNIKNFFVNKNEIKNILEYLRDSNYTMFERLNCVIGKDTGENFEITYILSSEKYNSDCAISCLFGYEEEIDSVCEIYNSANWDEREIYDLFGIKFKNHPELKRILLPNSFIGHPLRKGYIMDDKRLEWNYE